jgi:hypothetical protein
MALTPPEARIVAVLAALVEPSDRTELTPVLFLAVGLALQRALICFDFERLLGFDLVLLLWVRASSFFLKLDGILEADDAAKARRLAMDDVRSNPTNEAWRSRLEATEEGSLAYGESEGFSGVKSGVHGVAWRSRTLISFSRSLVAAERTERTPERAVSENKIDTNVKTYHRRLHTRRQAESFPFPIHLQVPNSCSFHIQPAAAHS